VFDPLDSKQPTPADAARQLQHLGCLVLLRLCYDLPIHVAFPTEEFSSSLTGGISSPCTALG